MMKYGVLAMATYLVLATITGCGAQPQATQESVAPPLATEAQMPSPLPPTENQSPTRQPHPLQPSCRPQPLQSQLQRPKKL
jgi:hypothetical protein